MTIKSFSAHVALAALSTLIIAMVVVAPAAAKRGHPGACGKRNLNCTYDASGGAHGHRGYHRGFPDSSGKHQGKHSQGRETGGLAGHNSPPNSSS